METTKSRRTKLTLTLAFRALALVRGGAGCHEVARRLAVSRSTLQAWISRGRKGEPGFKEWAEGLDPAARGLETAEELDCRHLAELAAAEGR